MIAICELLVARGLTNRVELCRLLPGHTHEDIDSKFSIIWMKIRGQHVSTPQQWSKVIEKCLTSKENPAMMPCNVEDIFVIPDYDKYMEPHMHAFKNYARGKWSQLVFYFTKVTGDRNYPNNVKMQYRAFSAQDVATIIPTHDHKTGLGLSLFSVPTYPEIDDPEPLFILKTLPDARDVFLPDGFNKDSYELLLEVHRSINSVYRGPQHHWVRDHWSQFLSLCPKSNFSGEYVRDNPEQFKIPLYDKLFRGSSSSSSSNSSTVSNALNNECDKVISRRATAGIRCSSQMKRHSIPKEPVEAYDVATGKAISKYYYVIISIFYSYNYTNILPYIYKNQACDFTSNKAKKTVRAKKAAKCDEETDEEEVVNKKWRRLRSIGKHKIKKYLLVV